MTTFFWLKYIVVYLGDKIKRPQIYLMLDVLAISFQFGLLIANVMTPTVFHIENGQYITDTLRPFAFFNQYVVYLAIGIMTLYYLLGETKDNIAQYKSVFWFALAPILSGIFQLLYPDGPFYSIGYFLGCIMVYIFVIAKEREEASHVAIMSSVANIYHSLHLLNLKDEVIVPIIEPKKVNDNIIKNAPIQDSLNNVISATSVDVYKEKTLNFVDLDTLSARLQDKSSISIEYVGNTMGWVRLSFIPVEKDINGDLQQVMVGVQVIDNEKREMLDLVNKSNTDGLTGFLNRRAYEEDISLYNGYTPDKNFVYVSLDVNGLKVVNDTLGHEAGDDLLRGAALCMQKCFGGYGKLYRMGGDEFVAMISVPYTEIESLKHLFQSIIDDWHGDLVDTLSVSCGYVSVHEYPHAKITMLAKIADKRMYDAKAAHYSDLGVDRRGQSAAHTALCNLYTKILKINLTTDTYHIVNMIESEQIVDKGFCKSISTWLRQFGLSGQVHVDDLDNYLYKTDADYMRKYFANGNTLLTIKYRRKFDETYRNVLMEMIPANDYTPSNQSLFLYVKVLPD